MNTNHLKLAIAAGLFLCILIFGFWLSRSGKPYNQVIFTIHKLIALGVVIYLARILYKFHRPAPFHPAHIFIIVLTAICILGAFVTGALLSMDNAMPQIVFRLHHVVPYLILLSTSASLLIFL